MKKHITHAALLLCTVLTVAASCSKEATGEGGAAGTGVLEMNISTTRAEADAEYDPKDHLVARIYNSRNELIRKYTSETFVKQLELIAGEYRIAVEAGLKVYTPTAGTGIWAGGSYEFRAVLGDDTTYNTDLTTAEGQTIPGGDMEDGNLPCFGKSTSETTTFWGSGNAATSDLCSQGTKPGMGGNHCAVLQSQSAFSLLAAGNLFSATFKFASLLGTVSFGMPYDWQARPTAMRVKCHATVGAVNKGTITDEHEYIQDGQDRSRIYVAIVDWNSRHQTSTGMNAPTGTWDPAKTNETTEGKIIAYGSLLIKDSTEGDEMVSIDIPICYYDPETKPSKSYSLIISCSTSTYGDYKVGCLGNVMYVDDFEWVY